MGAIEGIKNLSLTIVASFVLILLGIFYFMLSTWVIKVGAGFAGLTADGSWIVLTAGIITAATIIGSAIQQ